jgi:diketogulonate reductase-like aldo/keto reductase
MRHNPFGPRERPVPVIGQGTWDIDEGDRALTIAAQRRGLDLGMTHIDTAEIYGDAAPPCRPSTAPIKGAAS